VHWHAAHPQAVRDLHPSFLHLVTVHWHAARTVERRHAHTTKAAHATRLGGDARLVTLLAFLNLLLNHLRTLRPLPKIAAQDSD